MILLTALWFFLPAGFANMVPVISSKIPLLGKWDTPMDFGKNYRGKRIFGPHKTWRGLLTGAVLSTVVIALQAYITPHFALLEKISWIDYQAANIWAMGPLFGVGAILGDAVKSFFKRRREIAAGNSWLPFDQIDYIIGGLLFTAPLAAPSFSLVLSVFAVYFGLHLAVVYVFYRLGIREKPI